MKISIIIPVYNQKPEYFKQAVESVINQTRKPDEIIIIDDGSDKPIIEDFTSSIDIKIIRNEKNMGIGFSRQRGVEEATGDYIAFLSSDDIWDKDFLKIMIEIAIQNLGRILYSNFYDIDEEGKIMRIVNNPSYDNHEDFCISCWNSAHHNAMFVCFSTTFFPKKVFEKVKFKHKFGEDLHFLLFSMRDFEYKLVPKYLLKYRAVGNLTSRIWDKIGKNNEIIRREAMEYWRENE